MVRVGDRGLLGLVARVLADAGVGGERCLCPPGLTMSLDSGTRVYGGRVVSPRLQGQLSAVSRDDVNLVGAGGDCPSVEAVTARAVRSWRDAVSELAAYAVEAKRRGLGRVAGARSVLLRACGGRPAELTTGVGSRIFRSACQHTGR